MGKRRLSKGMKGSSGGSYLEEKRRKDSRSLSGSDAYTGI